MDELKIKKKARIASTEEIFWRDEQRKLLASGPEIMDKTAQTTLTVVSLLAALYTAALSGLEILEQGRIWHQIISLLPLALFSGSILLAFLTIFPKSKSLEKDSPEKTKDFIIHLTKEKKKFLYWAAGFMLLGLVIVIIVFGIYLGSNPVHPDTSHIGLN